MHVCVECKCALLLLSACVKCLPVSESIPVINLHLRILLIRTTSLTHKHKFRSAHCCILTWVFLHSSLSTNGKYDWFRPDLHLPRFKPHCQFMPLHVFHLSFSLSVLLLTHPSVSLPNPITSSPHSLTPQQLFSLYFCRQYANTPSSSHSLSLFLLAPILRFVKANLGDN